MQSAIAKEDSLSSTYLVPREGDPASLVENVSTIHGDYLEVEADLKISSRVSVAHAHVDN